MMIVVCCAFWVISHFKACGTVIGLILTAAYQTETIRHCSTVYKLVVCSLNVFKKEVPGCKKKMVINHCIRPPVKNSVTSPLKILVTYQLWPIVPLYYISVIIHSQAFLKNRF